MNNRSITPLRGFAAILLTLVVVLSCQRHETVPPSDRLEETEGVIEALARGDTVKARSIICTVKREAVDSFDYYLGVELEGRLWYLLSKKDSLCAASSKLSHFIERTATSKDSRHRLLKALLATQQGAYWARIMGRPDTAVVFDLHAIDLLQQTPRSRRASLLMLRALSNVADAYQQMGQFDKTIGYYLRAASLSDSIGCDEMEKMKLWMGLAVAYTNMGNFYQSERWWNQCALYVDSMAQKDVFLYLNNRGNDLFLQRRYDESMELFLRLDSFTADKPHLLWEHMFGHVNQAALYLKKGHPEEADTLLEQAEQFFKEQAMPTAQYYIETLRLEQALLRNDLQRARQISRQEVEQPCLPKQQLVMRLDALANYYHLTGQEVQQARAMMRHAELLHTLNSDQMRMQFQAAADAYEHEMTINDKERQLAEQQFATRLASTVATAAVVVIALLLVISVQGYRTVRLKRRNEAQRIRLLQDNIKRLNMEMLRNRVTPHFLSNVLSAPLLAQAEGRSVDLTPLVALLHQGMQLMSQTTDTLTEELGFTRSYIQVMQQEIAFDYREELHPDVKPDEVRLPSMMLQIQVENAIKHGLKSLPAHSNRPRTVTLKAWNEVGQGQVMYTVFTVTDTGIGLGTSRHNGTKTGLDVVRKGIELLNKGVPHPITFDIGNLPDNPEDHQPQGCCATLKVPHDFFIPE